MFDLETWSGILRSRCTDAKYDEVVSLFIEKVRYPFGFKLDHVAFSAVLKSCAAVSALGLGRALHGFAVKLGNSSCVSVTKGLLNLYAKCRVLDDCENLFSQMPKWDPVVWNTVLSGLSMSHAHDYNVMKFFSEMHISDVVKPSPITIAVVLPVCARLGDLNAGKSIHCYAMNSGIVSDTLVGNALISMYAKCGVVYDGAFATFSDMDEKDVVSWNAMIAGFHENNLAHDAYMLFRHMLQEPIEPNYATVATVLPLCAAHDNEAVEVLGQELHGYVARRTELRESNFVINSLMSFYLRIGRKEEAEILFYGMCSRDLVSWNAIIAGYVFNNDWARALLLFRELIFQWQEKPDCGSLVSILSACANMRNLQLGKQIHGYAYRHFGLYDGTVICNALISLYSKCGDLQSSLHTFMNSAQRDLFSWNSILDSFAKNGNESHVDNLLRGMIEGGLRPDSITMLTLFQFYGSLSSLLRVKEAHCYLLRSCCFQGDTENRLRNTMLEAYGKCGKTDYAFKIFESLPGNVVRAAYNSTSRYSTSGSPLGNREGNRELKKDIASWNYMIRACAENDIPENALALFHEMQDFGMKPDGESIISILPICARTASVNFLRQCHGYAVISFPQDAYLVGSLIDAYSKCGSIGSAYKLFISTCDKDLVMFTAMICGYAMHGMGKEALEVFSQILDSGIRPDNVVIAAVLSACSHSGLVDEGLAIFNSLHKVLGIKPTMEQYACIVDLLARRGRVRDAYSFVKEMPVEADSNIWGTLLGACWTCNDLELGKIVADHLSRIEVNDIGSYVAMSNLHAADAGWDGVKEMRELMKTRDLKKPAGCSWVEVDMVKHVFTSGNSSHPEAGAIYNTLGMLDRLAKQTLIPQAVNLSG
ncbi:hypothetical protein Droror1_Dr00001736 [Drosera rotundifolia]